MKHDKEVIPAIIAGNQDEFEKAILKVAGYVEVVQLDFMDGKFVGNKSIDFDFKPPDAGVEYEAHLMVEDPPGWVEKHGEKVDTILAPWESTQDPRALIDMVRSIGKRVGFVFNPDTDIAPITQYLDEIDQVLIMTVVPGQYGSPFLPELMPKIKQLRGMAPRLDIEVDGGITDGTIALTWDAGANMFVSGSFIVKSDNPGRQVEKLKEKVGLKG